MKSWKKHLVPALFALGAILALIPAVVKPLIKDQPVNNTFLIIALAFLVFAGIFAIAIARKPVGGSGPPNAPPG